MRMCSVCSEYKDSHIEWLGSVPHDWKLKRLKFLCDVGTGDRDTIHKAEDGQYPFFVRSKKVERISTYSFDGEAILTAGDGDIGKIFHYINGRFDFHQRVYKFSNFKEVTGRFFYYFISAHLADEVVKLSAKTTVDSLRLPMLQNFVLSYPPKDEQTKITNILDYETAKIDELIERQKDLILRLKEKRQAVISHAVTVGVGKSPKLKPSGIEWVDAIPENWSLVKAKYLFEEKKRPVRLEDEIVTVFRDGQVCLRRKRRLDGFTMAVLEHGYQGIRKGDLVLHSMDAFAGAIGVSEDDGRSTPEYVVVKPYNEEFNNYYFAHLLRVMAIRGYIFVVCQSVRERAPRFRYSKFSELYLPVPPVNEQKKIVEYISEQTAKTDVLVNLCEQQIKLLVERRKALISSIITGKISIQNWKASSNGSSQNMEAC